MRHRREERTIGLQHELPQRRRAQGDPEFQRELQYYLREFCGRPTPLYHAARLTEHLGGAPGQNSASVRQQLPDGEIAKNPIEAGWGCGTLGDGLEASAFGQDSQQVDP